MLYCTESFHYLQFYITIIISLSFIYRELLFVLFTWELKILKSRVNQCCSCWRRVQWGGEGGEGAGGEGPESMDWTCRSNLTLQMNNDFYTTLLSYSILYITHWTTSVYNVKKVLNRGNWCPVSLKEYWHWFSDSWTII